VIAIAITLLVLEIKVPNLEHSDATALKSAPISKWPLLIATVLSFAAIGTHWLNHQHFLRLLKGINHGFISLSITALHRSRSSKLFYSSVIVHVVAVALSLIWPWLALISGAVQVLTYLRPLTLPLTTSLPQ